MIDAAVPEGQRRRLRRIAGVCLLAAPFGWLLFWAVFQAVPGQDWVVFHTAAARFFAGDLATLGDPIAFTAELNRSHRAWFVHPIALHPWVYPPVTLLLAIAFGWLAYPVSLSAFLGVTLGLLVAALWWWSGPRDRLTLVAGALLCPATAFNLGAGQLGFLVAAAVLAGVGLLERRPALAGGILSLLCLKPQFVPLIPVALLAGRHWRAMAGALAGGVGLVVLSVLVVGVPSWVAWVRFATGSDPLLGSLIVAMRKYDQSVHTCLATLGAGEDIAGFGQMLAMGLAGVCVWWVFARPGTPRRRLIVLLCALVFGAPHVGDYDEIMPAIAAVLTLIDGRTRRLARGEAWLAAGVWLATAFNPPALVAAIGVPLLAGLSGATCLLVPGLMLVALRRPVLASTAGHREPSGPFVANHRDPLAEDGGLPESNPPYDDAG